MIQGYGTGSLVSLELWGLSTLAQDLQRLEDGQAQGGTQNYGLCNSQLGNGWGDLLGADFPSLPATSPPGPCPPSPGSSPFGAGSSLSGPGACSLASSCGSPQPTPSSSSSSCCSANPSPNGTEQMPSMHYVAFNAPANVHESTSTQAGPNGEVLTDTTYTDANGNVVYTDKGTWNPSTGILTDLESNGQGQQATVTSQVHGNQIISHVSGDSNVSEYTINFNPDGTNDQTAYLNNGTSQSYHNSSGSGPWTNVNVGTVASDYDQVANGNTVDAIDLTNAAGTYTSTLL